MKSNSRYLYWKTFVITLSILILCLIPAAEIEKLQVKITFADLIVHFSMFTAFVFVLLMDINKRNNKGPKMGLLVLKSIIAGVLFGGLTEILQLTFTFLHRSGNLVDLSFDFLGSLAGAGLFLLYKKTTKRNS
jgi:VanZ family protein